MVAMNVWPTDGADGSVATEARWRKMARLWTPTAVAAGVGLEMAPSLVYPNLTVRNGAAWVDGHYCELLGDQVLTVTANGIVVVRFDPAANTAELLYRDGVTVPAQSPTGTYEMLIASTTGGVMTDRRLLASPGGRTGTWVYGGPPPGAAFWNTTDNLTLNPGTGGGLTPTNGGRWSRAGTLVTVQASLVVGTAGFGFGTAAASIGLKLPFTPDTSVVGFIRGGVVNLNAVPIGHGLWNVGQVPGFATILYEPTHAGTWTTLVASAIGAGTAIWGNFQYHTADP